MHLFHGITTISIFQILVAVSSAVSTAPAAPAAPGLEYLYTAFADCAPGIFTSRTPKGIRTAIPIIGGNFTGPRLNGKILNLGADWGLTDPQTGIFSPDTRYQLQTEDNANIYIQTSGSEQPGGDIHLRLVFETGDEKYYWMNNIIAVGHLRLIAEYEDGGYTLQIDAWNLANEWTNTTFLEDKP